MHETCPACDSRVIRSVVDKIHLCSMCDHMFQNPPDVTANYNKQYVAERYDKYDTTFGMSALRVGLIKGYVRGGRLLDVGYGNGAFLKLAEKVGFDVFGCDVHGADYGIREVPLDNEQDWQAVTFFDSLEHFPDFALVKKLLLRTEYVVISYPKRPAEFPENRHSWKHYRPGEHLHYFSPQSLQAIVGRRKALVVTDPEDAIRGRRENCLQNIATVIFGPITTR